MIAIFGIENLLLAYRKTITQNCYQRNQEDCIQLRVKKVQFLQKKHWKKVILRLVSRIQYQII